MELFLVGFWLLLSFVFAVAADYRRLGPFFLLGLFINGFVLYFLLPALTLSGSISMLAISVIFGGLAGSVSAPIHGSTRTVGVFLTVISLTILIAMAVVAIVSPFLFAGEFYALPHVKQSPQDANSSLVSAEHIREVSEETAKWRAEKAVGNIGYKSKVSKLNIQSEGGKLVWLAPLDYTGDWKAWSYGAEGTGGYIRVSAENSKDPVKFVESPLRYSDNALFGYDLSRDIYFDYPQYLPGESVFQLDGQGKPVWVTMMSNRAIIGILGHEPVGIVITQPDTGYNTFYYMEDIPPWVDRVMDESVTEEYLTYWGKYRYGFINTILDQKDYWKPTGGLTLLVDSGGSVEVSQGEEPDVYLVQGTDGKLYWFGSYTTVGKDSSMVGYTLTDLKTGKIVFYPTPSIYNDIGAAKNVQQHPEVAKVMGARVTQPIMYNIDGQEVWIMPVITPAGENILMGAVVAKSGETFVSSTLRGTLLQLKGLDTTQASISPTGSLDDLILRLEQDLASLKEYAHRTSAPVGWGGGGGSHA